jgi:anti-anti-sigma factor
MEMTVSQEQATLPVTVLHVEGKLDGSTYERLLAEAQTLYDSGVRDLLLDLKDLSFLSSAGIASLHRLALLFQGKKNEEMEEGWASFRAIDRDRERGRQQHVKLLNPSQEVREVLDVVGFTAYFDIHTDLQTAVASFQ